MSGLRDVLTVMRFEWMEALRTKRVLVLVMLYVGGAGFGTYVFAQLLAEIEATLGAALAVATPDRPGAMSQALVRTEEFQRILGRLLRDDALAERLTFIPPVALFYGWLSSTFVPVMVMITASETITRELGSGSARYALVRTDGLRWATGKLLGQTLMMVVALVAGGLVAYVVAAIELDSFAAGPTLGWLVALSGRSSAVGFAYVGLALGLSQTTRSVAVARALGLGSLGVMGISLGLLRKDWVMERVPVLSETLQSLLPRAHVLELWRPSLMDRLPSLVMLLALGVAFFAAGFAYRARRDL